MDEMQINNPDRRAHGYTSDTNQNHKKQKKRLRVPMPAGTVLPIKGTDILIMRDGDTEEYSAGSTCLVYKGHIKSGTGIVADTNVIIKEFYPDTDDMNPGFTRQKDGSLFAEEYVLGSGTCRQLREQFYQGLIYQKELAGSNAMEISIRPLFECDWGSSTYIISDAHSGGDLGTDRPETLREIMSVAVSLAETMGILHDNGYIMTDIKADNFLWIRKPNTVRIIDSDSLVPFRDIERMSLKPLFANKNHISPELGFLHIKIREGTSKREIAMHKKNLLNPNTDRYSMGILLFELLFRRLPDLSGRDKCLGGSRHAFGKNGKRSNPDRQTGQSGGAPAGLPALVGELNGLYSAEISASGTPAPQLLQSLLDILRRLLIYNPSERRRKGYGNENAVVSDLQTIYAQLFSDKLVLRRETAKANARFAAYNLLQKYPLFDFPVVLPKGRELRTAIIGNHAMRADMLSAVLSIGQMPDAPQRIELIADDTDVFWEDYISEKNNPALARAVTWEISGKNTRPATQGTCAGDRSPYVEAADKPGRSRTASTGAGDHSSNA
ncbi:MAG: hypothetical protein Q4D81_15355, partial [Eubacteriales bacterium]|nr:hypothetical protein [Eubacteriales bacterium]